MIMIMIIFPSLPDPISSEEVAQETMYRMMFEENFSGNQIKEGLT